MQASAPMELGARGHGKRGGAAAAAAAAAAAGAAAGAGAGATRQREQHDRGGSDDDEWIRGDDDEEDEDDDDEYNGDAVDVNHDRKDEDPTGPFNEHTYQHNAAMGEVYREDTKGESCGNAAAGIVPLARFRPTGNVPSKAEIGRVIKGTMSELLAGQPRLDGSK
jgi:hypothetical protein